MSVMGADHYAELCLALTRSAQVGRGMALSSSILLGTILAATSPTEYPSRIGLSASSLHIMASIRFDESPFLGEICAALGENNSSTINASNRYLTSDDARVIGFFLERNDECAQLLCVAVARSPRWWGAIQQLCAFPRSTCSLDNNYIGDSGAAALGESLRTNMALQHLGYMGHHQRILQTPPSAHLTCSASATRCLMVLPAEFSRLRRPAGLSAPHTRLSCLARSSGMTNRWQVIVKSSRGRGTRGTW